MSISVNKELCTGCGSCEGSCPFGCITIENDIAIIGEGCTLCGTCEEICPFDAITINAKEAEIPADSSYKGVWVFAEQHNGKIKGVSHELISKGRELADQLGVELSAVLLGENVTDTEELLASGADKVYSVNAPELKDVKDDVYTKQMVKLIEEHKPEIVLAGATALGRSLMPRIAASLGTGLTADCTNLEIDPENRLLLQTRPAFGGNIMATIVCPTHRPQMATVRPRVFKRQPIASKQGKVITLDFNREYASSQTNLLNFIEDVTQSVNIEDADIVIAGGRGLGKPENFRLIEELAKVMGAAVGSSRPPIDEGWLPYSHQVGQTGKTVSPKLYIACGISGAVQHLAGMQSSDIIVAINSDPNAPIFEAATYGIVGDLFQVIPVLIDKLKN